MFQNYFGLIEATFVFGLAIAFYIWQMRSLKRDVAARKAREAREAERSETGAPGHAEGQHGLDDRL